MDWPTLIAMVLSGLAISAVAAAVGYYLQRQFAQRSSHSLPDQVMKKTITTKPLRIPTAFLVITNGPNTGQEFPVTRNTLIGRHPELCDIVLDDVTVSRQHARIRQEGEQFFIYDLDSENGTFVNNRMIHKEAELCDGDKIKIGNTEMTFLRPGE
jgi:pSer/pThr/pTyr-binding forkhead associated (FHA) protein